METIKKYNNRKLYSKTQSKYVTLPYLVAKLKNKESFTVVNAKGEDITNKVLRQALVDATLTDEQVKSILVGE